MRVLIVDDEEDVRAALRRALSLEGMHVHTVVDGRAALEVLGEASYDVVLLDVQMPGIDGLDVCRRLREGGSEVPVILVTARGRLEDRVAGLELGADDYVVKPFALDELLARMRAVTRRTARVASEVLRYDDLSFDPVTMRGQRSGREFQLSRTESAMLQLFLRNPEVVLSRERIFDGVWGYDFGERSTSHEVYVSYLRKKTEAGGAARLIQTVRGQGYVLRRQDA